MSIDPWLFHIFAQVFFAFLFLLISAAVIIYIYIGLEASSCIMFGGNGMMFTPIWGKKTLGPEVQELYKGYIQDLELTQ